MMSAVGGMLDSLTGPGFQAALDGMIASAMFGPHDDAAVTAQIAAVMSSAKQEVATQAFKSILTWPGADAIRKCTVPVMTVSAGPGAFGDARALAAECPHLFTAQTVGAGHFNQVFAADQVNAMLERFFSIIG